MEVFQHIISAWRVVDVEDVDGVRGGWCRGEDRDGSDSGRGDGDLLEAVWTEVGVY